MKQRSFVQAAIAGTIALVAGAASAFAEAGASDPETAMVAFAQAEIADAALDAKARPPQVRFVYGPDVAAEAARIGVSPPRHTAPQSYAVRRHGRELILLAPDAQGAMYAALDVADAIREGELGAVEGVDRTPYLERRGLKFNIPLDLRTPSYSDPGTAAQANIPVMWEMDFWRDYIDDMARNRFNVLTLWNLHPFPSLVRVPDYPNVALADVQRATIPVEDFGFSLTGDKFVTPSMLASAETVKTMSIDDKIAFWREVMAYADSRGVDVYWYTWNIFLWGAGGKDGLPEPTADRDAIQTDPKVKDYFRKAVRALVETYPSLDGIGVTAGERMVDGEGSAAKARWLRDTYGAGVEDALRADPGRRFRFVHRTHQTAPRSQKGIQEVGGAGLLDEAWADFPFTFDVSFKYAQAHSFAYVDPPFIDPTLPSLSPRLRTWLELRNDDVYSTDWSDPTFTRAFLKNLPGPDKTAGFAFGPDGYTLGQEALTIMGGPRRSVLRHKAMLFRTWGLLAFDPDLPDAKFVRALGALHPQADAEALFAALNSVSTILPTTTRFFWRPLDFNWLPEACFGFRNGFRGFYTVEDFVNAQPIPDGGVENPRAWAARGGGDAVGGQITPPQAAEALSNAATEGLRQLALVRSKLAGPPDAELAETINDIETTAQLGFYYAGKIRAAAALARFDVTGEEALRTQAAADLRAAQQAWALYVEAYTAHRVQPVFYNRHRTIDLRALAADVANDIEIAVAWTRQP